MAIRIGKASFDNNCGIGVQYLIENDSKALYKKAPSPHFMFHVSLIVFTNYPYLGMCTLGLCCNIIPKGNFLITSCPIALGFWFNLVSKYIHFLFNGGAFQLIPVSQAATRRFKSIPIILTILLCKIIDTMLVS